MLHPSQLQAELDTPPRSFFLVAGVTTVGTARASDWQSMHLPLLQVLLLHPVTTLLMMGTVAAVIVFLVGGQLWILGLRFNR